MTFPYFELTPSLYEHLGEALARGGFDAVEVEPVRELPPELAAPVTVEDLTAKVFLVRDGDALMHVTTHFDSTFGHHIAYTLYEGGRRSEAKRLKARLEQFLKSLGTAKK